ncbi:unnamed protein product [Candidula unifasciata]|uniref:Rab-GAP TBC domain-containing protein n=1 Tax=Candidula unifasciata TaxID=100452 RepID=A0A8S3YBA2_9EUPU|nr:unnamed protein product [Candidula unifasciata]
MTEQLKCESGADVGQDLTLLCEETQVASVSEQFQDSDSETAHSESSDVEESNGFQKVKLTIVSKGSKEKLKIALIRAALESDPVDVASLRKLAISPGGLVNKNMRQRVWPLLINANTTNITPKPSQEEMESMTKTYSQVVMDVNRSSSRFPPGIDDHVRMSMKDKLVDLIMRVMLKHQQLRYYQRIS